MTLSTAGRITLGLLLASLLAAPVPAAAQDKPRLGGELIFPVPSEPPSYDAHEEETFGVIHPLAPHYSTLVKVDPFDRTGTKPVGDLAESWIISKDGMPLDSPYAADTIAVGPGERYTVLINPNEVGTWVWHCHILNHVERATGMFGMVTALVVQ